MNPMTFTGWPIEAVEFYEGLEADNSKVYWQEHKTVYERYVRGPMEQLLAELADEFGRQYRRARRRRRIAAPSREVRESITLSSWFWHLGQRMGSASCLDILKIETTGSGVNRRSHNI